MVDSIDIGTSALMTFTKGSHDWAAGMNQNFLKASVLLHGAAKSRSLSIPAIASASNLDTYIDPETGSIYVAQGGVWYSFSPSSGYSMYVIDSDELAVYRTGYGWRRLINMDHEPASTPRVLSFFNSGEVQASSTLFRYVCGQEFTLPSGALGSHASLSVAPTSDFSLSIVGGSGASATISFTSGQTQGVVYSSAAKVFQPVLVQDMYQAPDELAVVSPSSTYGAEGLSVTLRGVVRPITED